MILQLGDIQAEAASTSVTVLRLPDRRSTTPLPGDAGGPNNDPESRVTFTAGHHDGGFAHPIPAADAPVMQLGFGRIRPDCQSAHQLQKPMDAAARAPRAPGPATTQ